MSHSPKRKKRQRDTQTIALAAGKIADLVEKRAKELAPEKMDMRGQVTYLPAPVDGPAHVAALVRRESQPRWGLLGLLGERFSHVDFSSGEARQIARLLNAGIESEDRLSRLEFGLVDDSVRRIKGGASAGTMDRELLMEFMECGATADDIKDVLRQVVEKTSLVPEVV